MWICLHPLENLLFPDMTEIVVVDISSLKVENSIDHFVVNFDRLLVYYLHPFLDL